MGKVEDKRIKLLLEEVRKLKSEKRIELLLEEVQKQYFPEIEKRFIVKEKYKGADIKIENGNFNVSIALMSLNNLDELFYHFIAPQLSDESIKGAIGHELSHYILGHTELEIRTKYKQDTDFRNKQERDAENETVRRGLKGYNYVNQELYSFILNKLADKLREKK